MDIDFQEKFRDIINKMGELGESYAEAKGQSYQMQELKGAVIASIIAKSDPSGSISITRSEILAKSSEDYKRYVEETSQAIKKELKLKAQYEKYKCSFEALRSLSSLEKSTRNQIEY